MVRDKSTLERSKGGGPIGFIMDLPLHLVNLIYFVIFWLFFCGKYVLILAIVFGAFFYFLPDYRTRAVTFINRTTGINLAQVEISDYVPALYGERDDAYAESEDVVGELVSREQLVEDKMAKYDIPKPLKPFVNALLGHSKEHLYFSRLSRDQVGERGEGAVSMLKKVLKSPNGKLQKAAEESLTAIGTPEAMRALYR